MRGGAGKDAPSLELAFSGLAPSSGPLAKSVIAGSPECWGSCVWGVCPWSSCGGIMAVLGNRPWDHHSQQDDFIMFYTIIIL